MADSPSSSLGGSTGMSSGTSSTGRSVKIMMIGGFEQSMLLRIPLVSSGFVWLALEPSSLACKATVQMRSLDNQII